MSRNTLKKLLAMGAPRESTREARAGNQLVRQAALSGVATKSEIELLRWKDWLYDVERGVQADEPLSFELAGRSVHARKLVLAAMARNKGFSCRAIARHLSLAYATVCRHMAAFEEGGVPSLLGRKQRSKKIDDPSFTSVLFGLLHEPPALSGYNRTTWRIQDLHETLEKRGISVCKELIGQAIRTAGFRWRAAKVVLTSSDPEYREKLERLQSVLSNLKEDERFFSIDEFGPFAIKAKPGRVLAGPGEYPSVPQWQKSKGWLILTAALELSRNQVTHFYSRAKNTTEMIRMAERLLVDYANMRTLFISWDAASWHMSKRLLSFIESQNAVLGQRPRIELVPLPASAQFLNVIESVFSGMARSIIHNSDYPSVDAARAAIDRYFAERNQSFRDNPKRAGKRIWGNERTAPEFDPANNCKDAAYR